MESPILNKKIEGVPMKRPYSIIFILFFFFPLSIIVYADSESAFNPVETNDNEDTFEEVLLSALDGNAEAQRKLGYFYLYGQGVTQSSIEAVKWYRKSAEQGLTEAQLELGYINREGIGIRQNYAEAVKWYRKAAEQGHAEGQSILGFMYRNGFGVEQDYPEALKWFRKAAKQGDARAQSNLGLMYHDGLGIQQDFIQAYAWFGIAAAGGFEPAQAGRDLIGGRLNSAQLEEAREFAKELWEKYGNKNNN